MSDTPNPEDICPKCGEPLGEIVTTPTGRKLQRCSAGKYDPQTRKTEGCTFVKWFPIEPKTLEEKCPKCGAPLLLAVTRFGKKLKKCSTAGWDNENRKPTGCDYVQWITGTSIELDEKCPECGAKLVLYTTAKGKKMKKCSTAGWDKIKREATGCTYVQWLKPEDAAKYENQESI
ncbi:MAG: topoisomerase DNA-binding C4 zinc finger domain-containing protein [Patescibacteria group bacterium]|nr:topoisomerase DNA-binding C4 zinc finger domain-containing protein [Patescibacteria group bacterium]